MGLTHPNPELCFPCAVSQVRAFHEVELNLGHTGLVVCRVCDRAGSSFTNLFQ